jgi:integrase
MAAGGKLNAATVAKLVKAGGKGRHGDGAGLWLQVDDNRASWLFRYTIAGRQRQMGLGGVALGPNDPGRSLSAARDAAAKVRDLLREGKDPLDTRAAEAAAQEAAKAAAAAEATRAARTFRTAAEHYIASHRAGWRNDKHADQWTATLTAYAYPVIGDTPVAGVDTQAVLSVLKPIWQTKPETASRVRGRIEAVLNAAAVLGWRDRDKVNPAAWRGHLDQLLPRKTKVRQVEHHAALPRKDMPGFMAALRQQKQGASARALEFTILTAARTSETLGARWREFDMDTAQWTVPASRMKAGRPHRVPLSDAALAVVQAQRTAVGEGEPDPDAYVFPGARQGRPLSNMALLMTLRRMKRGDLTAHGFRSTFRDWAAETTTFPREVCEAALAHVLADKTEAAYRRGDLFTKRRDLMAAWARWCAGQAAVVVSLQQKPTAA